MMTNENNTIIHFEEVWQDAEKLASAKYSNKSIHDLITELEIELKSYAQSIDAPLAPATQKVLKTRQMGTILFLLAAISQKDDINVWAALRSENMFQAFDVAEMQKAVENSTTAELIVNHKND